MNEAPRKPGRHLRLLVNGERVEVELLSQSRDTVRFILDGRYYEVGFEVETPPAAPRTEASRPTVSRAQPTLSGSEHRAVSAPIPGVVVAVLVQPGAHVQEGEILLRLEAMKMENNILSPRTGTVAAVHVQVGDEVSDGQPLVELEA